MSKIKPDPINKGRFHYNGKFKSANHYRMFTEEEELILDIANIDFQSLSTDKENERKNHEEYDSIVNRLKILDKDQAIYTLLAGFQKRIYNCCNQSV